MDYKIHTSGDREWLRVQSSAGVTRHVDLARLAEIAADDSGWEALAEIMATKWPGDESL